MAFRYRLVFDLITVLLSLPTQIPPRWEKSSLFLLVDLTLFIEVLFLTDQWVVWMMKSYVCMWVHLKASDVRWEVCLGANVARLWPVPPVWTSAWGVSEDLLLDFRTEASRNSYFPLRELSSYKNGLVHCNLWYLKVEFKPWIRFWPCDSYSQNE